MAKATAIHSKPFPLASLPQELIDLVIDNLDDNSALAACSLVCKAWLPAARRNIFRTLNITRDNLAKLRRLVDDRSSTVLTYVKGTKCWWMNNFSPEQRDSAFSLIRDIKVNTRSESLHITLHRSEFAKITHITPFLRCIRHFALYMPAVYHPCDLGAVIALVSALPLLHSLYLGGYVNSEAALELPSTTFPHLHTIGLRMMSIMDRSVMEVFLSWMLLQSFPVLRSVYIACPTQHRNRLLHRFLQSLGSTLQHLYIETRNLSGIDLPAYTHLNMLYIIILSHDYIADTVMQAVPRLAHLETVYLDFTVNLSDLETPGWGAVDAALLQLPPHLRLRIVVRPLGWEDAVRVCLWQCFARGVVEVVHPHQDNHAYFCQPWLNCRL